MNFSSEHIRKASIEQKNFVTNIHNITSIYIRIYCRYIEGKVAPLASPVGTSRGSWRSTQPQRRLIGQKTSHALPMRLRRGTLPKKRLSKLNWELSPIIK